MKKLLFTALMSISLFLVSGEDQRQEKQIYLIDYFDEAIEKMPHFKLADISAVDCVKINALSEIDFKYLMYALSAAMVKADVVFCPKCKKYHALNKPKLHKILFLINKCRSVLPFVDNPWYKTEDIEELLRKESLAE